MRRICYGILCLIGIGLLGVQLSGDLPTSDVFLSGVSFGVYALLAGLIIFRRDGHSAGWLLLLLGLLLLFADASLYLPGASATFVDWVDSWIWTAVFAVFGTLTLTFPSGHPPEGHSRAARLGRFSVRALPVLVAAAALTETLGGPEAGSGTTNPIGFLPSSLSYPLMLSVVAILLGGVVSLVVKRRRAVGVERAQITWVVFGFVLLVTTIVLTFAFLLGSSALGYGDPGDGPWTAAWLMMVTFPLWFGIAILRYRLFEIDRIVSRTVSYSLVVAFLAAVFGLLVTVLASLLPAGSNLRVAASTLVVAALFSPVRRNVQRFVERRFNRSHYDATRVGMEFGQTVRDEVDPDRLVQGWMGVVATTMQPNMLAVWIRSGADPGNETSEADR